MTPRPGSRALGGRLVPALAIGAGAAGAILLTAAIVVGSTPAGAPSSDPSAPPGEPATAPRVELDAPAATEVVDDPSAAGIATLPDPAWAVSVADATSIPERAVRAYAGAAIRVGQEQPGCALGWNTLAGVGHVESEHGTIDGESIGDDGRTSTPIIGIALDGTTTDRIPDTDGGALDGDMVWDRAVGPMQFIPSTWAEWGADGDGDGGRDPQQIDDASLAAARYLCAAGGALTASDAWLAAIASYNSAPGYATRVADAASHYARQSAGR